MASMTRAKSLSTRQNQQPISLHFSSLSPVCGVNLSKNEKSRPVAGGPAEVAMSRRESTSGQAESKILHRALKSQAPVVGSHISQIKLLYFKKQKFVDKSVRGPAEDYNTIFR